MHCCSVGWSLQGGHKWLQSFHVMRKMRGARNLSTDLRMKKWHQVRLIRLGIRKVRCLCTEWMWNDTRYQEKIFYCGCGEPLEHVVQKSCGCPGSIWGQTGWNLERSGLVGSVPSRGGQVGTKWYLRFFPLKPFYGSMIQTTEKRVGPKQNVLHKVSGLSDAGPLLKTDFSQCFSNYINFLGSGFRVGCLSCGNGKPLCLTKMKERCLCVQGCRGVLPRIKKNQILGISGWQLEQVFYFNQNLFRL